MGAGVNPETTGVLESTSADRLVLRIHALDEDGEQVGGQRQLAQLAVEGIIGSPEGRAIGSPGDIRFREDVPQIYQKITGVRTRTGWQLVGGGGISGLAFQNEGVAIATRAIANFLGTGVTVVDDDPNARVDITIPLSGVVEQGLITSGVTASTHFGAVDSQVVLFSGPDTVVGSVPLGDWIVRDDDADDGTTFTILQSGIYWAAFTFPIAAGFSLIAYVTKDADSIPGLLIGTVAPDSFLVPAYGTDFKFASTIQGLTAMSEIQITNADIAAGRNIIRAQYGSFTGAPLAPVPDASLANAPATTIRIFRDGDIEG